MPDTWKTFGHTGVKKILERQLSADIFPHAYLFVGPEGVGKKTLALEFAQKVLRVAQLGNHPDFQLLEEAGQIPVERVREFSAYLNLKPFVAKRKAAIIDNAQNLSPQSGNALLKILEEPPSRTIFILIASGRKLLPTIVSRCQVFNFNAFSLAQLREFAQASGLTADEETMALSFGSVARLKRLAADQAFGAGLRHDVLRFQELKKGSTADRLLAVAEFAEREPEDLGKVLLSWYYWQAGSLKSDPGQYKVSQALSDALQQLQTNKNKKLILQGLFLKI